MSHCLNPHCPKPQNLPGNRICVTCGTRLLLKERYRAVALLGTGGMGRTFLAIDEDTPSKRRCVIKQFFPDPNITASQSAFQKAVELFIREAATLDRLGDECKQIPRLLAYLEQDQRLYLVQEFVEGQNLLKELIERGTGYSELEVRQLLQSLLPVLRFIHQRGVIHRDIKLENIMRRLDGELVLIDFGISKELSGTVVAPGTVGGTLGYAPAEQILYGKAYPESDLYSLGATCIHLLTNIFPHNLYNHWEKRWNWRETLTSQGKTISEQMGKLLDKLLQEDHRQRYHTADEVLMELHAAPTPQPVQPTSPPVVPLEPPPVPSMTSPLLPTNDARGRHGWTKPIVTGAVALLVGFGGYAIWQSLPQGSTWVSQEAVSMALEHIGRGKAFVEQRDYDAALENFNRAIELNPNLADAYNWRGFTYAGLGNQQQALNDYDRAIELNPRLALAYSRRGVLRATRGDTQTGLADCNRAIELDANDAKNFVNRGLVYLELENSSNALADFNRAIQVDPQLAIAYYNRAVVYRDSGEQQNALTDLNTAIDLDPRFPNAFQDRAELRNESGDLQGAEEDYSRTIELAPTLVDAYFERGLIRSELGNTEDALADYTKVIELDPNDAVAYFNRGVVRSDLGDATGALQDYNRVIELDPNYAYAYNNRGILRRNNGDQQGALQDYTKAIELDSAYPNPHYNRGLIYRDTNNKQAALKDFQRAAELYQQLGETQNYQDSIDQIEQINASN